MVKGRGKGVRGLFVNSLYKEGVLRDSAKPYLREVLSERIHREPDSECWWYQGDNESHLYQQIYLGAKRELAHRLFYMLYVGEIPHGMLVRHRCDTPPCVNPDHLELGSHLENAQDRTSRGRSRSNGYENKTHCPQGHEYTEENTYLFQGRRYCRACHKTYSREYWRRKRS